MEYLTPILLSYKLGYSQTDRMSYLIGVSICYVTHWKTEGLNLSRVFISFVTHRQTESLSDRLTNYRNINIDIYLYLVWAVPNIDSHNDWCRMSSELSLNWVFKHSIKVSDFLHLSKNLNKKGFLNNFQRRFPLPNKPETEFAIQTFLFWPDKRCYPGQFLNRAELTCNSLKLRNRQLVSVSGSDNLKLKKIFQWRIAKWYSVSVMCIWVCSFSRAHLHVVWTDYSRIWKTLT